jgi:hypothetical protein
MKFSSFVENENGKRDGAIKASTDIVQSNMSSLFPKRIA